MKKSITLILVMVSFWAFSQEQIFVVKDQKLYSRQASFCALTLIGVTGIDFLDIALTPDGNLWGVDGTNLYQINPQNGNVTLVGNMNTTLVNSLVAANNSLLFFEYQNSLYTVNVADASIHLIGYIGYKSYGDITWYDNDLYMISTTAQLIRIKVKDDYTIVESVTAINEEDNPIPRCEALITVAHNSFNGNILLGMGINGLYQICHLDGTFSYRCNWSTIYGATATRLVSQFPALTSCPTLLSATGIQDENKDIQIIPNPVENDAVLQIKLENTSSITINIINLQGVVLFSSKKSVENNVVEIDIQSLNISSGVYFVQITDNERSYTSRLVVK